MRFSVSKFLMFFLILLMLIQPVQAKTQDVFVDDASVCMNATQKFEKKYEIKQHLLTTISSVETGRWNKEKMESMAWPWTVNAEGKGTYYNSKREAVAAVKKLQAQGIKSIDVGCMQINLSYHGDAFENVEEAFEPAKNVEYGAKFLKGLYESKGNDWIKAAMAYHSGTPQKALKYKKKIVSRYEMVKNAQNDIEDKLFGKTIAVQPEVKKVAQKVVITEKNNVKKVKKSVISANEWREAKLAEYRRNKNK